MRKYVIGSVSIVCIIMVLVNALIYGYYNENVQYTPVIIYVVGISAFFIIFILFFALSRKKSSTQGCYEGSSYNQAGKKGIYRILGIVTAIIIAFLFIDYFFYRQFLEEEFCYETGNFINIPKGVWGVIFILSLSCAFYLLRKNDDISAVLKQYAYTISLLVTFVTNLVLNPYGVSLPDTGLCSDVMRTTYVTETIYNVIDKVPFGYDTMGLYGHYGLFFFPVKWFGPKLEIYVIGFVFALLTVVQQLVLLYVINTFVKKNWIAVVLAIGGVVRWTSFVEVIYPIRTLFPMLLFGYLVYIYKKRRSIYSFKELLTIAVILVFSLLWNVESGCICVSGFVTYSLLESFFLLRLRQRGIIKKAIITVALSITAFGVSIGIVNIYNLLCGGGIGFRSFFYPLIGTSDVDTNILKYVNDDYGRPPLGNHAWEYILLLFLFLICSSFFAFRFKGHDYEEVSYHLILCSVSVMGLVAITYYMNEALWNCLMIVKQMVFGVFSIILGKNTDEFNDNNQYCYIVLLKRIMLCLLIAITVFFGMQIINDPIRIASHKMADMYNVEKLETEIEKIAEEVPENAFGVGQGVTMIYHYLDRNNRSKLRDTSAWEISSKSTYERGINEILNNDKFFICYSTGYTCNYDQYILEEVLRRDDKYSLQGEYTVGGATYQYYSR